MKNLYQEFKEFAFKGNIIELAIAFVLGAAFATVVSSLVDNILLPIVAAIFGQPDFSRISIDIGESEILYGSFLNAVLSFLLVAAALFFFVVKPYKAIQREEEEAPAEDPGPSEVDLLIQIRDALRS